MEKARDKRQTNQPWKRFIHLLRSVRLPWGHFILSSLVAFVGTMAFTSLPEVEGKIAAGKIYNHSLISRYSLLLLLMAFTQFFSVYSTWVKYQFDRRFQKLTLGKFLTLPMKIFERFQPSDMISRVTDDTTLATELLNLVITLATDVQAAVLMIWGLFHQSKLLSALTIPLFVINAWAFVYAKNKGYSVGYGIQDAEAKMTAFLAERVRAIRYIKATGQIEAEYQKGEQKSLEWFRAELRNVLLQLVMDGSVQLSSACLTAGVLIGGAVLASHRLLSMEQLISFYIYSAYLPSTLQSLVFDISQVKLYHGSIDVVTGVNSLKSEPLLLGDQLPVPISHGDLAFHQVPFAYGEEEPENQSLLLELQGQEGDEEGTRVTNSEQEILTNLSVCIPKGQVTAIVGPSGSGKSTLLKLLTRLYQPSKGELTWKDEQISRYQLKDWRRRIAYVLQNTTLISGTIRDNLLYETTNAISEEQLMAVCQQTNIYDFIQSLPKGFDSQVQPGGSNLSGGEVQRLALCRALLADPELLILDEATSNLDHENAKQFEAAVRANSQGKTIIVVSHNMRTLLNADYIIVMKDGQIEDAGSHEELCERQSSYSTFCRLQGIEA